MSIVKPKEGTPKFPIRASYIWLSGKDSYLDIRGKDRTLYWTEEQCQSKGDALVAQFSDWNFDGSSTGQAKGKDTEIVVRPVAVFKSPFTTTVDVPNLLKFVVLCECYLPNGEPTPDNTRRKAMKVFSSKHAQEQEPWYGIEQEYFIMRNGRPIGWPEDPNFFPAPQGPYYCGNGADRIFGRRIVDKHYDMCLAMGIKISGSNAEVTPGQWEFQVGPCVGVEAGDHLIVARWLFSRILEEFSVTDGCTYTIDCEPKPVKGDWNGSGLHTNFSTKDTRDTTKGMATINKYVDNMKHHVDAAIAVYGSNNHERLSGKHETSRMDVFTYGVGTRDTSVRIPTEVARNGYGYLEDRRPGGNADPYLVTSQLYCSATNFEIM
eukprot:Tbor_TRINITY_DN5413_c2_g1::TRINITY_DN5413_c2_g1_i2::g.24589::m.24589/K01915/glnA, GLUL; glutamine synthetase